ncbi:MAG: ATP-binding cassette domain-containing protein [Chitinivibrionales bacterium]|nr:ATP-binding cassette domain-containing protein [Chitinivibrionales bacterium]
MVSLQDITLHFGERALFDNLSWHIHPGSRAGLVGANGSGKTTLFRIILNQNRPDAGQVVSPKDMTIGYLPQEQAHLADMSVIEYLRSRSGVEEARRRMTEAEHALAECDHESPAYAEAARRYERASERFTHLDGYAFDSRAEKVLRGLGFADGASGKRCPEFSGGWQMRICLAALLLEEPDMMLLDEPTNHLDTDSMEWLEAYLKSYQGTIVTIAHDRAFLDRITDTTAVLQAGALTVYAGNYSAHLTQREQQEALAERRARTVARKREQMERFVERFRAKNTKASQVQSRIKMLEKMESPDVPRQTPDAIRMSFAPCTKSSLDVFEVRGVSKRYGDLLVFSDVDCAIHRGEKVGIVGVNGAGKSTLLRLLTQAEQPSAGTVEHGTGLTIGYFSQVATQDESAGATTVWDEACAARGTLLPQQVRDLLGSFLFRGDDINKPVTVLSGGERSRLTLLKLLLQAPNVLVLDEPTNHLDMTTKEVFLEALRAYDGTLLLVSHDRYLLDHVVGRVLEIRKGHLYDYAGNYSYFLHKRELDAQQQSVSATQETQDDTKQSDGAVAHAQRKQQRRYREQLERRRDDAESEIGRLEERKVRVEQQLCDPAVFADQTRATELGDELATLEAELTEAYSRWNELCDRVAGLREEADG